MPAQRLAFRIVFLQYFGFFIIGVVLSLIGPLIPLIRADLHLSYGAAGVLFPAQLIGSVSVLVFSSLLIHVFEKRKLLAAGSLVFAAGLLACGLASNLALLIVGNIFIGAGVGAFEIGMNTLCLESHPEGKGRALNRLHFFFGTGAVIGPLVALAIEKLGAGVPMSWRWAFGLLALMPAAVFVILLFTRLPVAPHAETKARFAVYKRPLLWFTALAICLYCGVEWGVGGWFPSYWKATELAALIPPAVVTSLFWLTFSIGRFTTQFIADRLGFRRFLTIAMAATLAAVVLWFFIPAPAFAFVLVLCLGLIIAGLYPTLVALASQKFPASSGQVASFLSVFGVVGSAIFPAAVGFWADASGIGALVGAEVILTVGMIVFALLAFAADRKQKPVA
jgi:fucose permease